MEKKYTHWAPEEIKFLISIWRQDEIMRQASTKKNEKKKRGEKVFREWSAALARGGYTRDWQQVKNKMRSMIKAYNKVTEQNGKSGSNRVTCEHYEELHRFLKFCFPSYFVKISYYIH